jgi:hypothetical protein
MECTRVVAAVVAAVSILGAVASDGTARTGATTPEPTRAGTPATVLGSDSYLGDLPDDLQASANRAW